jgi:hypothetical protein
MFSIINVLTINVCGHIVVSLRDLKTISSTVVKHLSRHPKVKVSSLGAADSTGREEKM